MAAPFMRFVQMSRATLRPHTTSFLTKGAQTCPHITNVVICRTISAEKARKNRLVFYKTIAKFAALFVFMGVTSPYWTQLKGHRFEPRREKKRRKLAAESEAVESGNSHRNKTGIDSRNHSLLPSVKAAEVVEGHEGIGYVPPRSKRFNFIADAVEVAAPAVVYIEIQGRFVT